MAEPLAEAFIRLRADGKYLAQDVRKESARSGDDAGRQFGKRFADRAKSTIGGLARSVATVGGAALGAGFTAILVRGLDQIKESQAGLAQTRAVIKSTGGAAKVTAQDVAKLAAALQKKTGADDDVVRAGANMLLTFCLEESAQALTKDRGWVSHADLHAGDEILALDPADDSARWEPVQSVHRFDVDGELTRWRSKQLDVLSTPHHRWLTDDGFQTTAEIGSRAVRVRIGGGVPEGFAGEASYTDELVELAGWVVTEGWVNWARPSTTGSNQAAFSQSETANPDKVKKIRELIRRLRLQGHRITERSDVAAGNGSTMVSWYFARDLGATVREMLPGKKLTMGLVTRLTREQASLLLDTMIAGDGHTDDYGHRQYIQKDRGQLDVLAAMCGMLGIRTTDVPSRSTAGSLYLNSTNHAYGHNLHAEPEHYKGIVWCPHLRTGVWLARVRGRTFWTGNTNVRNELGKGNDIFNQATATVLDMSQALGQDTKSSAIQLGKALNDPIKGVTALQRVGVTFTASQKDTIKSLVDSGRTLDAQKIILGELNKEFGKSAEAYGKTLPGQIDIAKNEFDDFSAKIVGKFLPTAIRIGTVAAPAIATFVDGVTTGLGAIGWESIAAGVRTGFTKVRDVFKDGPDFTGFTQGITAKAGQAVTSTIAAFQQGFESGDFGGVGDTLGKKLGEALAGGATSGGGLAKRLLSYLKGINWLDVGKQAATVAVPFVIGFVNNLLGAFLSTAKEHPLDVGLFILSIIPVGRIAGVLENLLKAVPLLKAFAPLLGKIAEAGKATEGLIGKVFSGIGQFLGRVFETAFPQAAGSVSRSIKGLGDTIALRYLYFRDAAVKMLRGLLDGIESMLASILRAGAAVVRILLAPYVGIAKWLIGKGRDFLDGLRYGIDLGKGGLTRAIGAVIHTMLRPFVDTGKFLVGKGRDLISGLLNGALDGLRSVASWSGRIKDAIVNEVKRVFGIHSPSTVFAELGGYMIQGLITGLAERSPTEIIRSSIGGLPDALAAMVSKGFVGLGSLPGKAMGALGKVKGFFSGLFGGGKDNFGVTASVSRWAPIAAQALALAGAPISWLPSLMKRMQRESGGNPSAINNWDINAKHGDPSRGLMQCVTLDTRILTDRGWLTYDQVQVGDRTIGYNSATGRSEWTTITRVVTYDDAPVWRVGHKRWHADVTPNHRWWSDTRTASGKTRGEFVRTEDFNTMHRIRLAAPADTDGIPGLSLDDVAVLAWLQGDGTYREAKDRPGHYDGAIFQSKPGMVVKIRALLARVPHTESIRAPRTRRTMPQHVFRLRRAYVTDLIKRSEVEDTGPEAFVLRLSPDQRALWLAAMIDAEGHRMPGKRPGHSEFVRIAQAVGPMQDAIRLAVYLEGWRPTYSENSARRNGYQPAGVVGMAKPHVAPVTFHDPVDLPRQTVWCVKTGLETWTAELDGQVFLTGNTIGATFNAYAGSLRGRGIYDPLANIYAAVRYTIARYGSGPAGWDRAGGYDSGGLLMPGSTLAVNATGRPERILNAEHTARLDALLASGGSGRMHPDDIRALAAAMSNLAVLLDGQQVGKVVDARLNAVGRSAAYRRSER